MTDQDWLKEFPGAVTVCDAAGVILDMNDKAAQNFDADGGKALIGHNLLDCHPESARIKVEAMLANRQFNIYTIEKNGVKKLIYQSPWYEDGQYRGFVELSLVLPGEMPHFIRD